MSNCTICGGPLFRRRGRSIEITERARLTEVCEECHMLGRRPANEADPHMTKSQWRAVVDMLYDSIPYGPETLRRLLDKHTDELGGQFEPWRTWAMERWTERFGRKPY